jgi:hypothetical protein
MGRELFDFAFREYSRRWKFKRPMPADFFRTIEDASARDLDWFWRGWFYTTDHCDIALDRVEAFLLDQRTPDEIAAEAKEKKEARLPSLSQQRNRELPKRADEFPELKDFYNEYDPAAVTDEQRKSYEKSLGELSEKDREMLASTDRFYRISFKNVGGLVMPIILLITYEDGSTQEIRLPAEIWRVDSNACDTLVVSEQPIAKIELDPYRETADVNRDNNYFPTVFEPTRFQLFKALRAGRGGGGGAGSDDNPMSRARRAEEAKAKAAAEAEKKAQQESKPAEVAEPAKQSPEADGQPTADETRAAKRKAKQEKKKNKKKVLQNV